MQPAATSLICYDLAAVSRFFRSVAMAITLQRYTTIEWVNYRDSQVLNAVYAVLFWKGAPGTAEIQTADSAVVQRATDELHERFLMAWIGRLVSDGPAAANAYVSQMTQLRDSARDSLNELFHDAAQINNEVASQTRDAIVALARIRLAATVGVAVIGAAAGIAFVAAGAGATGVTVFGIEAGTGAAQFGATGFGYSAINTVIKTWEQAPEAKIAAVAVDTGKYAGNEIGGHVSGHFIGTALAQSQRSAQIIKSAEGQIRKMSARLAQEHLRKAQIRKATSILAASQAQAARETANLAKAGQMAKLATGAAKGIPVVFAAWDILDAIGDYNATVKTAGR